MTQGNGDGDGYMMGTGKFFDGLYCKTAHIMHVLEMCVSIKAITSSYI